MKVKCWKCSGRGRVRYTPLVEPMELIFTAGIITAVRALMENDIYDSRFWYRCPVCEGEGFQYDHRRQ